MSSIQIVALVTVKPEYTETLAAQFKALVKASRAEAGNISYDYIRKSAIPTASYSWKTGSRRPRLTNTTPVNISKASSKLSMAKPTIWKSY